MKSIHSEQEICINCGFCCDGTIFTCALLRPDEIGYVPEKIAESIFIKEGKHYFSQPCPYFNGKCSIYHQKKAYVCSAYRCQLLNNFRDKTVTKDEALSIVENARSLRQEIIDDYRRVTGDPRSLSFRELLRELSRSSHDQDDLEMGARTYERLIVKCNIFEALLIKHFKSASDFDSMSAED